MIKDCAKFLFLGVAFVLALMFMVTLEARRLGDSLRPEELAVQSAPSLHADPATQQRRYDLFCQYQQAGIIKQITTPDSTPRLYVYRREWAALDFDMKKSIAGLAYCLCASGWCRV